MIDQDSIRRSVLDLKRLFDRFNDGDNHGRFKLVGRGDGSRPAEAFDDARFLDHAANARSGIGEMFVTTTPNEYHRRGLVLMDHSPRNYWGGSEALELRIDLMRATAEAMILLSAQSGHYCGAILPDGESLRLVKPYTNPRLTIAEFERAQGETTLLEQVTLLASQARQLEFAVLVLDPHALKDEQVREALTHIARFVELVVVEVSDPWDYELPRIGKVRMLQNGKTKRVDTNDPRNRQQYAAEAEKRQATTRAFLGSLRKAQYHFLTTAAPFAAQFTTVFAPPSRRAS